MTLESSVKTGWLVSELLSGGMEVTPIGDTRDHTSGEGCWCSPFDDDGVLVHNSLDRREEFERHERSAS